WPRRPGRRLALCSSGTVEVAPVGHGRQARLAGEPAFDHGELAGDADRVPGRVGSCATSWPATRTPPPPPPISEDSMCTAVVLPAPLGPNSAKVVPSVKVRSMPLL